MNNNLTEEQRAIIDNDSEIIVANAVAGSGKTTTFLELPKKYPDLSVLYMCFNSSIKQEIKKKCKSKNVDIHTFHSLAYDFFKNKQPHIIKDFDKRVQQPRQINANYNGNEKLTTYRYLRGNLDYFLMEELMEKAGVEGEVMEYKNLLTDYCKSDLFYSEFSKDIVDEGIKNGLIKILNEMKNNSDFPFFHDFYLKLFSNATGDPNFSHGYDILLLDEAQDLNECNIKIAKNLNTKRRILLGDSMQQLYKFRGAIDALKSEDKAKYLPLSNSWRTGPDTANFVNNIMKTFFNDNENFHMNGKNEQQVIVEELPNNEQYTIVFRNNITLMEKLIELVKNENKKIYIVGGSETIDFEEISNFFDSINSSGKKKFLFKEKEYISSYSEALTLYEKTEDRELKRMIDFCQRNREHLNNKNFINIIKKNIIENIENADVVLSTTHKSKGLEFENVEVSDDYSDIFNLYTKYKNGKNREAIREEIYCIYVAITRSTKKLKLSKKLSLWYETCVKQKMEEKNGNNWKQFTF